MTITKNTALLRQLVIEHVAADSVIQGQYWNLETHKGCFIGCLVHSDDPSQACELFGLTHPVLRIAEAIFEGLPKEEAVKFFSDFPDAIATDGKDLSLVHWKFLASELRDLPKASNEVQEVINTIIAGIDLLASGEHWDPAAADAAARAADAAARAADAAARAADAAADAAARAARWAAARAAAAAARWAAADAAARAADAAGWAADAAADAAARAARWAAADAAAAARAAGWAAADAAAARAARWAAADAAAAARAAGWAAGAARSTVFMRQRDLLLNLIRQA